MLDAKVTQLLNEQITKEFYSAYLYLDFSNYFEEAGLDGFANWYYIQAQEERDHAMLFYTYLQTDKGGHRRELTPTDAPEATFALAGEKPVAVYAYCNLHGLWKTEI